jgi:protein-serine/threonine kinase
LGSTEVQSPAVSSTDVVAEPVAVNKNHKYSVSVSGAETYKPVVIKSDVTSRRVSSRTHRRGTASVSYGADKFFSKILGGGSSPPHNRRHSVIASSSRHSVESQEKDSKERKRFSLLSFYSSYADSPKPTTITSHDVESASDAKPVPKNSKASNRSQSTSRSDDRKILEPAATDSLNQRQNRASPPRHNSTKSKYQHTPAAKDAKEQSAARKVVEFFKRRSRIA